MQGDIGQLKQLIRTIPDFPKPGIQFRDVTTLVLDPWGLKRTIELLTERVISHQPSKIVAIESRGFIFGTAIAEKLGCGLVLARKKGKLPGATEFIEYDLEYGRDRLEIHRGAIQEGDRCLIVDDLLATGGTALATAHLVERMGGHVVAMGFVVNLPEIGGTQKLSQYPLHWLLDFEGH